MELNQLKYFLTVAKYQHMTQAANELHISQSSLSKTISTLENDIGVKLFDRTGNKISLNAVGIRFLERITRALREIDDAISEACGSDAGRVTFAVNVSGICADFMSSYIRKYPDVQIKQLLMPKERMIYALENNAIDFAISYDNLVSDTISWEPFLEDEVLLLVSKMHPLANRGIVDLKEFQNDSFICSTNGFGVLESGSEFCKKAGFSQKITFEGNEPAMELQLVASNHGVMFMSSLLYNWQLSMEIVDPPYQYIVPLRIQNPECVRTLGVAQLKGHYISATADRFKEGLLDNLCAQSCSAPKY